MDKLLLEKREAIAEICVRHGVLRLYAFGSAVREDFQPGSSDLDLLVEFAPMPHAARADAYFGLLQDFRELFGRKVDLVVAEALKNRFIAEEIERTKQVLYAA